MLTSFYAMYICNFGNMKEIVILFKNIPVIIEKGKRLNFPRQANSILNKDILVS